MCINCKSREETHEKEDEANGEILSNGKSKTKIGHHHGRKRRSMSSSSRLVVMLTMTFAFFLVELVFGYVSHSMALIADSFHMLSDVMALAIAYGCVKASGLF